MVAPWVAKKFHNKVESITKEIYIKIAIDEYKIQLTCCHSELTLDFSSYK